MSSGNNGGGVAANGSGGVVVEPVVSESELIAEPSERKASVTDCNGLPGLDVVSHPANHTRQAAARTTGTIRTFIELLRNYRRLMQDS
jgi:hypothetical protein